MMSVPGDRQQLGKGSYGGRRQAGDGQCTIHNVKRVTGSARSITSSG